jgi:hypothetical protein
MKYQTASIRIIFSGQDHFQKTSIPDTLLTIHKQNQQKATFLNMGSKQQILHQ